MTSLWWYLAQLALIAALTTWAMVERQRRERVEAVNESLTDALEDMGKRGAVLERQVQSVRLIYVMVQAAAQSGQERPQKRDVN